MRYILPILLFLVLIAAWPFVHQAWMKNSHEASLQQAVTAALAEESFANVGVDIDGLDVILSGQVATEADRQRARQLADSVFGARAREVNNLIEVELAPRVRVDASTQPVTASGLVPDEQTKSTIIEALAEALRARNAESATESDTAAAAASEVPAGATNANGVPGEGAANNASESTFTSITEANADTLTSNASAESEIRATPFAIDASQLKTDANLSAPNFDFADRLASLLRSFINLEEPGTFDLSNEGLNFTGEGTPEQLEALERQARELFAEGADVVVKGSRVAPPQASQVASRQSGPKTPGNATKATSSVTGSSGPGTPDTANEATSPGSTGTSGRASTTAQVSSEMAAASANAEPTLRSKPLDIDKELAARTVQFRFASSRIYSPEARKVREVAALVEQQANNLQLQLNGHACTIGSASYNMMLSIWRAEAVAMLLADYGVDPSQIQIQGYGETQPLGDPDNPADQVRSRRVEFGIASDSNSSSSPSPQSHR